MSLKTRRKNKTNTINNKIIEPLQDDAQVLGPGQMASHLVRPIVNGVKLRNARKRKHVDSQSEGLSLDEMMNEIDKKTSLELSYDTDDALPEKTNREIPKSDSLSHVLVQGLQSKNDNMIQTALQRCDSHLIRNTINGLPNDMVEPLLNHLHKFFFHKGEKNRTYIMWLETLIRLKLSVIITAPSVQQQLASIRELLQARCEIYERLYMLKGKLNLITDQIDKSSDLASISDARVVYQESSSDDDDNLDRSNEKTSDADSDLDEWEKMNLLDLSDQELEDDSDREMECEENQEDGIDSDQPEHDKDGDSN